MEVSGFGPRRARTPGRAGVDSSRRAEIEWVRRHSGIPVSTRTGGEAAAALAKPQRHGTRFPRSLVLTAMPGVFIIAWETEVLAGPGRDEARLVVVARRRRSGAIAGRCTTRGAPCTE